MKSSSTHLDRLLRAASAAPRPAEAQPPYSLEARVLAAKKRTGTQAERPDLGLLFRYGFACACLLMLAAAALSVLQVRRGASEDWTQSTALVNSALSQ